MLIRLHNFLRQFTIIQCLNLVFLSFHKLLGLLYSHVKAVSFLIVFVFNSWRLFILGFLDFSLKNFNILIQSLNFFWYVPLSYSKINNPRLNRKYLIFDNFSILHDFFKIILFIFCAITYGWNIHFGTTEEILVSNVLCIEWFIVSIAWWTSLGIRLQLLWMRWEDVTLPIGVDGHEGEEAVLVSHLYCFGWTGEVKEAWCFWRCLCRCLRRWILHHTCKQAKTRITRWRFDFFSLNFSLHVWRCLILIWGSEAFHKIKSRRTIWRLTSCSCICILSFRFYISVLFRLRNYHPIFSWCLDGTSGIRILKYCCRLRFYLRVLLLHYIFGRRLSTNLTQLTKEVEGATSASRLDLWWFKSWSLNALRYFDSFGQWCRSCFTIICCCGCNCWNLRLRCISLILLIRLLDDLISLSNAHPSEKTRHLVWRCCWGSFQSISRSRSHHRCFWNRLRWALGGSR